MELIFTDGNDRRFVDLCHEIDEYLNYVVGGENRENNIPNTIC